MSISPTNTDSSWEKLSSVSNDSQFSFVDIDDEKPDGKKDKTESKDMTENKTVLFQHKNKKYRVPLKYFLNLDRDDIIGMIEEEQEQDEDEEESYHNASYYNRDIYQ